MKTPFFAKKLNFDNSTEISLSLTWGDVRASPRGVSPAFSQPKYFQKIKPQNIFISEKTQKRMPFSKNEISTILSKFRFRCQEKTFEFHFWIFRHPFYSLNNKYFQKIRPQNISISEKSMPFSIFAKRRNFHNSTEISFNCHEKTFILHQPLFTNSFTKKILQKSAEVQVYIHWKT